MITDPPKTLVSTAAVGVGSDVLFGLLRKMLNKHFTMAADEHREGASDSSVSRHYDEANAAENEFSAALAEVIADKERLNWLEKHGVSFDYDPGLPAVGHDANYGPDPGQPPFWGAHINHKGLAMADTLRATIDAARLVWPNKKDEPRAGRAPHGSSADQSTE